jgi:hypothetical protein
MTWTTPADLKTQVQRLWDRGLLLAALAGGEPLFPRRLVLKGPTSRELSERFPEVRDWIARISAASGPYRIEWRTVNHRVLGVNEIPAQIWIDSLEDAFRLISRRREAERFAALLALTGESRPELTVWLARRPLRALELAEEWPRLLAVVTWCLNHPRPAVYLRQIDLPGVHTKFIEGHKAVLAELLDLVLPEEAIDGAYGGASGFCRRYGFLDKPSRVRFRVLDPAVRLLRTEGDHDITLTERSFASLDPSLSTVFITENEINFLAFPDVPGGMVLFGAGYGFDNLAGADWLHQKKIHYWGDIDTHGFAILNQLRGLFPHARSFLMDQQTFLIHRSLWGMEPQQETADLARLNDEECDLYDQLRCHRWGDRVRLEQERIGFDFLLDQLGLSR